MTYSVSSDSGFGANAEPAVPAGTGGIIWAFVHCDPASGTITPRTPADWTAAPGSWNNGTGTFGLWVTDKAAPDTVFNRVGDRVAVVLVRDDRAILDGVVNSGGRTNGDWTTPAALGTLAVSSVVDALGFVGNDSASGRDYQWPAPLTQLHEASAIGWWGTEGVAYQSDVLPRTWNPGNLAMDAGDYIGWVLAAAPTLVEGIALVRSYRTTGTGTAHPITVTVKPKAGRLLVVAIGNRRDQITSVTDDGSGGWAEAVVPTDNDDESGLYYKLATAADEASLTTVTVNTFGGSVGSCAAVYGEFHHEDGWAASPLDVVASTPDSGANVGSRSTGTTAANAAARSLVLGGVMTRSEPSLSPVAWTNGFQAVDDALFADGTRTVSINLAMLRVGDTATRESTATISPATRAQGFIAVFKPAAGGGTLTAVDTRSPTRSNAPALTQHQGTVPATDTRSPTRSNAPQLVQHQGTVPAVDTRSTSRSNVPAVTQRHSLTGHDTRSTTRSNAPAVTQHQGTVPTADTRSSSRSNAPPLTQTHPLTGNDTRAATRSNRPPLGTTGQLTAVDTRAPSRSNAPQLTQQSVLTGNDTRAPSRSNAPQLTQQSVLTGNDTRSPTRSSAPAVAQTHPLDAVDTRAPTRSNGPPLTQHQGTVPGVDTRSATRSNAPTLVQRFALTAVDTRAPTRSTTPALTQTHPLTGHDTRSATRSNRPPVLEPLTGVPARSTIVVPPRDRGASVPARRRNLTVT